MMKHNRNLARGALGGAGTGIFGLEPLIRAADRHDLDMT